MTLHYGYILCTFGKTLLSWTFTLLQINYGIYVDFLYYSYVGHFQYLPLCQYFVAIGYFIFSLCTATHIHTFFFFSHHLGSCVGMSWLPDIPLCPVHTAGPLWFLYQQLPGQTSLVAAIGSWACNILQLCKNGSLIVIPTFWIHVMHCLPPLLYISKLFYLIDMWICIKPLKKWVLTHKTCWVTKDALLH